jgi:predicted peptidase
VKNLLFFLFSMNTLLAFETSDFVSETFIHGEGEDEVTLGYRSLRIGPDDEDVPLLLFLHGAGERGSDNEAQLKHGVPDLVAWLRKTEQNCHIVVPQCPSNVWWVNYEGERRGAELRLADQQPILNTLQALVSQTVAEHSIDSRRHYLTGLSMGGFGTLGLLADDPEPWAGAIAICGGGDTTLVDHIAQVPLQLVHGDRDDIVSVTLSRALFAALRKSDAPNVHYTELLNTGHDSWTPTYRDPRFWEWLFAQQRKRR